MAKTKLEKVLFRYELYHHQSEKNINVKLLKIESTLKFCCKT